MYKLDINKGDIILRGKYRNKKEVVKTFGHDDKGQPTINGKRILNFNIEKLLPKKEIKEIMKKSELKELIKECLLEEEYSKRTVESFAEDIFFEIYEIGKSNGYPVQEHGFLEETYKALVKYINKKLKQGKISRGGFGR